MGLKCGIVGLPNVGKSTLFNALTAAGIAAENYPFCTIEPNIGVVAIPDPRLAKLAAIANPERVVPAVMEFVDIAGLVAGAARGEGLGNKFLSHIRETDAIIEVVRCFEDENVVHVAGRIDPLADIEVIHTELGLADLESVDRALARESKAARAGNKDEVRRRDLLAHVREHLNKGGMVRTLTLGEEEQSIVRGFSLLTAKPVLYVGNVREDGLKANPLWERVTAHAVAEGAQALAISAAFEAELVALPDEDKPAFLAEIGLSEPGLARLVRAAFALLGLETFFTAGPKEVRAWTMQAGCLAPQAAGVIHSDFEQGFIRAEVIGFEDYIRYHGEAGAREAGRLRLEGRDYRMQDGDVMHFRFNVSR
ncbi:MAG: redox-regulated ATPase YchF [Acidiferrobacter sp.]